jgi:hypothetical protein
MFKDADNDKVICIDFPNISQTYEILHFRKLETVHNQLVFPFRADRRTNRIGNGSLPHIWEHRVSKRGVRDFVSLIGLLTIVA